MNQITQFLLECESPTLSGIFFYFTTCILEPVFFISVFWTFSSNLCFLRGIMTQLSFLPLYPVRWTGNSWTGNISPFRSRLGEIVSSIINLKLSHYTWQFCSHTCNCFSSERFLILSGIFVYCFDKQTFPKLLVFTSHIDTTMSPTPNFSYLYCYNVVISSELG